MPDNALAVSLPEYAATAVEQPYNGGSNPSELIVLERHATLVMQRPVFIKFLSPELAKQSELSLNPNPNSKKYANTAIITNAIIAKAIQNTVYSPPVSAISHIKRGYNISLF